MDCCKLKSNVAVDILITLPTWQDTKQTNSTTAAVHKHAKGQGYRSSMQQNAMWVNNIASTIGMTFVHWYNLELRSDIASASHSD